MGVKQSSRSRAASPPPHHVANIPHGNADDEAAAIQDGAPAHPGLDARLPKEQFVVAPAGQSQGIAVSRSLASRCKAVDDHRFVVANRIAPIGNPNRLQIGCQQCEVIGRVSRDDPRRAAQTPRLDCELSARIDDMEIREQPAILRHEEPGAPT